MSPDVQSHPHRSDSRQPCWHQLDAPTIVQKLGTDTEGLSQAEAVERQLRFGLNQLSPPPRRSALLRFLAQFHNVLIYVLLASAVVTLLLRHWVDAGVILGVVLANAVIGFIQEGKAERALDAIRGMLSLEAHVRRDGHLLSVPAHGLVPGDVVFVQSGDKVPADLRLFRVKNLRIDEAMLTGESLSVEKSIEPVAADAAIGDRLCIAYSGTLVTYGQGFGVVVATGDTTEIGRISAMLGAVETLETPLTRQLAGFSRWLTLAIVLLAGATFALGVYGRGFSPTEMFLAAVGLAVAAIPEGLPAIMTITLAIGVQRMARRHAIIRRLPAVETLGAVTVICSDKTGTLTRNEMTVTSVATAGGLTDISGAGYHPHGSFTDGGREVEPAEQPSLLELCRAAVLCNDANVIERDGQWSMQGDPTEGALVTLGLKAGLDVEFQRQEWPRTDVIPFESEHRFMATLHHDHAGHGFVYLKGAPEQVLRMCNLQRMRGEDVPLDAVYWARQIELMAQRGQRLLAIAFKAADGARTLQFSDVEYGLTLLGLVGIMDPLREDAARAVAQCRSAGIRVKMITGDHAVTALAIGRQLQLGEQTTVLTGTNIDALSPHELRQAVRQADVFARASPEHKLRLVHALQANGEVVAMTGDGVNDAPALKRADIGIAMGRKGTEVAKEAAEMVLADDNFASIVYAIEEGRTVYDNLRKAILFMLPTNGGEAFTLITAIALGLTLPITPVQILWVNTITAVTLALALAFEPVEPQVMRRPPRPPRQPLLTPFFTWRIAFVTLILVIGTFGLYLWEREHGASIEAARTVAVNTLVFFEMFYLFSARFFVQPALNFNGIFGNRYALLACAVLIAFQLLFTYSGPMQQLFATADLKWDAWLRILLVSSSVLFLVEFEKVLLRLLRRGPREALEFRR